MYLWLKALHIIAVISWMAGLLYLPRLLVYHADSEKKSRQSETFKVMEQRLYRAIMGPAMLATWIFGFSLLAITGFHLAASGWWIAVKIAIVALLTGFHIFLGHCVAQFRNDLNQRSARFYKVVNEVPTVLMVTAVILVVFKPF